MFGRIFPADELVELLHHAVDEGVARRSTAIVLDHVAVAVVALMGSVIGFAAREHHARERAARRCLEHRGRADHVDLGAQHGVGLDLGAHKVGKVDDVGRVGVTVEDLRHRIGLGDVGVEEFHLIRLPAQHLDRRRRRRGVDHDQRYAAGRDGSADPAADESGAASDHELHSALAAVGTS